MARFSAVFVGLVLLVNCMLTSSASVSAEDESPEDVNVVEFPYANVASSNIEGNDAEEATEGSVSKEEETDDEMTTPSFLPEHIHLAGSGEQPIPPAEGKEIQIGNLTVYESPSKSGAKSLIVTVVDIFGFHPHVKYIADKLSKNTGSVVVIPDFYHGNPWDVNNTVSPPDFKERIARLFGKNEMWANSTKPDLMQTIKYYAEKQEFDSIGIFGFCWGEKMIAYATSDPDFKNLTSFALVHPSQVVTEDANDINIPGLLLPSGAEPDMIPFLEILNKNNAANTSEHYRFDDMIHGFAGARSDWNDPKIRSRVEEVIEKLTSFFTRTLQKPT